MEQNHIDEAEHRLRGAPVSDSRGRWTHGAFGVLYGLAVDKTGARAMASAYPARRTADYDRQNVNPDMVRHAKGAVKTMIVNAFQREKLEVKRE